MKPCRSARGFQLLLALVAACSGPTAAQLEQAVKAAEQAPAKPVQDRHSGPETVSGATGPARFAKALYDAFQRDRAFDTVAFADRFYREPGSEGYEATLEYVERALRQAGFGQDARLEIEVLQHDDKNGAWTPRSARLALIVPGEEPKVLQAFENQTERDRVMLPRNAPSARIEGAIALDLQDLREGEILVTEAPLRQDLINRAEMKGAAAVVSASLGPYNVDPTGKERHRDAIQYRVLKFVSALPVAQISPRVLETIEAAKLKHPEARLAFEAKVDLEQRPVRTLVATVVGDQTPGDAVVVVSHVQEPGACDNATGVASLLEGACSLAKLLEEGKVARPARSLVFIWGDELQQSRDWLESGRRKAVAAISSDMTGQSRERTGAIALLERMPDPGAVEPLPPDEHTPWGVTPVESSSLSPNGLAVVARCALIDVDQMVGGWETGEHPWEGGSDHDVFIESGIPAVLFWHFTDFAYHTSLDRLDHVDPEEMHRTGVAILSAALAIADPEPADLDRYLRCLTLERDLRIAACEEAKDAEVAELWKSWCTGARLWLRAQCLGLPFDPGATGTNGGND